ncbi:hypothetical protein OSTOST_11963 [Ostertagia ostertagi]
MFSLALLVFFLASVIDGQETPLPPDMKEVFMELNSMYKPSLVWDDRLAKEALEESRQPHTLKADAKVMATRTFWKKDQEPTKEMLETMKDRFAQRKDRVDELPMSPDTVMQVAICFIKQTPASTELKPSRPPMFFGCKPTRLLDWGVLFVSSEQI